MISSIVNPLFFFLNLSNNPMNNPFHINKTFSTDRIIASVNTHITGKNFSQFPFLAFRQSKLGRHFFYNLPNSLSTFIWSNAVFSPIYCLATFRIALLFPKISNTVTEKILIKCESFLFIISSK